MEDPPRPSKKRKLAETHPSATNDHQQGGEQISLVYTGQSRNEISENVTHISVVDSVQKIEDSNFKQLRRLRSVAVRSSVEIIGKYAFYHCRALTKVHLQQALKSISSCAFDGCIALVEVDLPLGLQNIRSAAFRGCKSICAIDIPGTVQVIKKYAFQNCSALKDVQLNEGLELIACGVFCGCTALSAIALPSTLKRLDCPDVYEDDGPFEGCSNLLGVEIPADSSVTICANCFYLCERLMNISIPPKATVHRKAFNEACGSLRTQSALARLRSRFARLPVHHACYHSSQTSLDSLLTSFDVANRRGQMAMADQFGMTPLHLVATSVKLRQDILGCLLDRYPVKFLERKDKRELTMMDYLLKHTSRKAVPLIKMTLYRAVVSRTFSCETTGKQRLELSRLVEAIPLESGTHGRRKAVCAVFRQVGYQRKHSLTSVLELALWKKRIAEEPKDQLELDANYRGNCLCQSGAEVVVKNVFGYLWHGESNLETSFSMFPLCYLSGY